MTSKTREKVLNKRLNLLNKTVTQIFEFHFLSEDHPCIRSKFFNDDILEIAR